MVSSNSDAGAEPTVDVEVTVNGVARTAQVPVRATLLDVLRERWGLTGTKKGCDLGQCGACTVHLGDAPALACLTLTVAVGTRDVTTIEGLSPRPGTLHRMQEAFVAHDALQCGYCTPGQIMSAVALVRRHRGSVPSRDTIAEEMSGNICRCGAYGNIVDAVASVVATGEIDET